MPDTSSTIPLPLLPGRKHDLLRGLLSDYLYKNPFPAPSVKFSVKYLLPGTKVKLCFGNRDYDLPSHDRPFKVGVPILLSGVVVTVKRRVMRCKLLKPPAKVLMKAGFIVVYEDTGSYVHGIYQAESFSYPAFFKGLCDL